MKQLVESVEQMQALARQIAAGLKGGEVIELAGDIGAGKTTFVKGLAAGLGITEDVQSPTFTISRVYEAPGDLRLAHYDFYRLADPGIMKMELAETARDPRTITVIEWAGVVEGVLPAGRTVIRISSPSETSRLVEIEAAE